MSAVNHEEELTPYTSPTFGNPLSLRVDTGVGAITISPSGRDIALASRSGLFIVDLDDPFSPPRWLHHRTSWEVADVQWSPHTSKPYWVISTSNQKALVWNLALASEKAVEHVLHGHQRAITDINFHSREPEIIATCSVDSYVHVWDLREPRAPSQSFSDWRAGATQVKWNRRDPNILASSHDTAVYIWDRRMGSIPLHKIVGHTRKVNGLDFSRTETTRILTSSNDKTVREWDYNASTTHPEMTIRTDFPVWRARHTPFGSGCMIMPYLGGSNSLYLHKLELEDNVSEQYMEPTKTFRGHGEPVREFVWRFRGGQSDIEDREFQLITWSKDHDLRLWPVDSSVLNSVGYMKGARLNMPLTRKGAKYQTYRSEPETGDGYAGLPFRDRGHAGSVAFGSSPTGYHQNNPQGVHHYHHNHHNHHSRHHTRRQRGSGSFVHTRTGFMTGGYPRAYSAGQSDSMHHLDWIAGVRFGRSALNFSSAVFENTLHTGSAVPVAPPSTNPSNFGEEVSLVGHKFPKLRFEKISVSTGECVITLHGPWGQLDDATNERELVFMRLTVRVPVDYPFGPPDFGIEEDEKLAPDTTKQVLEHMSGIASELASHGVYALEPCLRYLMGDPVSVQDYLDEHKRLISDDADDNDDDEPNEMEDVPPLEPTDSMIGFDYVSSSETSDDDAEYTRPQQRALDSTPIPKGCGAVWGKNGELVCFFQTKRDRPRRLPSPKPDEKGFGDSPVVEADESDGSDSDDFESDSDDFATPAYAQWPVARHRAIGNFKSSLRLRKFGYGGLGSTGAATTLSATGSAAQDQVNVIKVVDFKHLIASRRDLAVEYRIMGAPPRDLCKYNGRVAEKYECWDVAFAWNLLYRILNGGQGGVDGLARKAGELGRLQSVVSMISTDGQQPRARSHYRDGGSHSHAKLVSPHPGLFEWRSHPFGSRWLVEELFAYFEKQQNTQMLADMSCVLSPAFNFHYDSHVRESPGHGSSQTSVFFKSPGDGPPLREVASYFSLARRGAATPRVTVDSTPHSIGSPNSPFSSPGRSLRLAPSPHRSTMASSENTSAVQTANNSYRSTFLPVRNPETDIDLHQLALFDAGALPAPSNRPNLAVPNHTTHSPSGANSKLGRKQNALRVDIINKDLYFGGEDILAEHSTPQPPEPLLDPKKAEIYAGYRDQYAALLYLWGLEVERLEVLKFNYLGSSHVASAQRGGPATRSPFDEFHTTQIQFRSRRPLDDPEIIRPKEIALNRVYSRTCQYCRVMIRSRFFQCPSCEHITHSECAETWWMQDGGTECVSGCGCNCLAFA